MLTTGHRLLCEVETFNLINLDLRKDLNIYK